MYDVQAETLILCQISLNKFTNLVKVFFGD